MSKEEKKDEKVSSKKQVKKEKVSRKEKTLSERKREVIQRMDQKSRFRKKGKRRKKDKEEFDVRLVSIRRVSKVKKGGKRLRMSVMAVIGDKFGNIGVAVAKGKDVRDAQNKAVNKAKKKLFKVPVRGQTIPHEVTSKYKAAQVLLKPASPGTGVIAGGAVRSVVEVAGIKDILSKRLGSRNIISNVYATFKALKSLRLNRFSKDEIK